MAGPIDHARGGGAGSDGEFVTGISIDRRKFLQYGLGGALVVGSSLLAGPAGATKVDAVRRMTDARAGELGTETKRQSLAVASISGAANLDPNLIAGLAGSRVWSLCYDTFFNTGTPAPLAAAEADLADFKPLPKLVSSYSSESGGTVWRFNLNPKAKSAAGNLLSPADIIWSAKRHLALQLYGGIFLNRIGVTSASQFTGDGAHAVVMTLPETIDPTYMLLILGNYLLPIYDSTLTQEHVTSSDPWASSFLQANTAGFGPYVIESRSSDGTETVLTARKGYYGTPVIPKIIWNQVTDSGTQLELLLAGTVQVTDQLSPTQLKTVEAHKGTKTTKVATAGAVYMGFANNQAPFNDVNFHQGLAYAIDFKSIVHSVWEGTAKQMKSILPPWFQASTEKYWVYDYNPTKAKALLAPYLHANLQLSYDAGNQLQTSLAELILGALANVGMTIELNGVATATYAAEESAAAKTWWLDTASVPLIPDSLYALQLLFLTVPTQKLLHYSNPLVDAAVATLQKTRAVAKQDELILTAQKHIMHDLPIIPIAYTGQIVSSATDVVGFTGHGANIIDAEELSYS